MPHFAKHDVDGNILSFGRTDINSFDDRVASGELLYIIPPDERGGRHGSPPRDFDKTHKIKIDKLDKNKNKLEKKGS